MAPKLKSLTVRPLTTRSTRSMTSASTPEDTIKVQQRLDEVEISDDDVDMDKNNNVEEFDFSNEPEYEDEEDDGHDTAHIKYPNGVMPISSDDEDDSNNQPQQNYQPSDREWRDPNFGISSRHAYESMFCEVPERPMADINGVLDIDVTEDYMRERDHEMLRYIEDYPLPRWVIPQAKAQDAHNRLMDRIRWRSLGIRIYRSNMAGFGSLSSQPFHSVATQMPPPMSHSRNPSLAMPSPRAMGPPLANNALLPQNHMAYGSPTSTPNGRAPPPPPAVLPSQPTVQLRDAGPPINTGRAPTSPNTVQSPTGNGPVSHHAATYAAHAHLPSNGSGSKGKARERKTDTPPVDGVKPRIPTPPYETRDKPPERKLAFNPKRKNQVKKSEADDFPWNRQIDFKVARINAVWDDSIYAAETLKDMAATRARNVKVIERIDGDETERQRLSRVAKKSNPEGSSDVERPGRKQDRRKISGPKPKAGQSTLGEQHAGVYTFATEEDVRVAFQVHKSTADEVILAYEVGEISLDVCAKINIYWNAGKKGSMAELEQVRFSIRDLIVTREQIASTPVLTHQSAVRIVDFCPHLVWRDMLLRIASEAGYGNKEIRDRLCHNGNYVDKATITKRIGAALGQKQLQATVKTRMKHISESSDPVDIKIKEEIDTAEEYYNTNVADFSNYMEFFGHRSSHRNQLAKEGAGLKRKIGFGERGESSGVEEIGSSPRKRKRVEKESVQSPLTITSTDETTGMEGEDEMEEDSENQGDAVSVQSDTLLDEIED